MDSMNPVLMGSDQPNPNIPRPPAGAGVYKDFFTYQVPVFSNLAAAGGVATNNLLIQSDSDFEWVYGTFEFDLAAAAPTWQTRSIPNMTILIVDTGSGRQLMSAAVPVPSLFGPTGQPVVLPISKVFARNSTISFTATNFDAAVATGNLRLSLMGWKIFYF